MISATTKLCDILNFAYTLDATVFMVPYSIFPSKREFFLQYLV